MKLLVQVAHKIVGIRFLRDFCDVLKRRDALLRFPKILVGKSEVVPGIGILGKLLRRRLKRRACRLQLLLSEQRNTQVQSRHRKLGVGLQRLFKIFLRVRGALLIQVGNAQRIETISVRHPAARCRGLLYGRGPLLRGRPAGTHQYRPAENQEGTSENDSRCTPPS